MRELFINHRAAPEIADTLHAPVGDASDPSLVANSVAGSNSARFTDETDSYAMAMSGNVQSGWSAGNDTLGGANNLTHLPGTGAQVLRPADTCGVTFLHLMSAAHQIILANVTPAESFCPGLQAVAARTPANSQDLVQMFPTPSPQS